MFGDDFMYKTLFVYGTLMKGHCNDHYLREQKYIGIGKLKNYEMFHVNVYPGIIEKKGEIVVGELYEVNEEILLKIDQVECEGDLFVRKEVEVILDCEVLIAETYIWNKEIDAKMQKVVEMPWQPIKQEPCRNDFKKITTETPFTTAKWPIIIRTEEGQYFEACTIRGAVASIVGASYLENQRNEDDWQMRLKFAFEEVMGKNQTFHIVIHDQKKGIVAENMNFEDEESKSGEKDFTRIVHIENERSFLFSLVSLKKVSIYERKSGVYFRNWNDDGNDHTLYKENQSEEYIDISTYEIEDLLKKTWI